MSLRLVEVFLPDDQSHQIEKLLDKYSFLGVWHEHLDNEQILVKILLYSNEVEPVIDRLNNHFSEADGFRLLLLKVEASIPRPQLIEPTVSEPEISLSDENSGSLFPRINREELYVEVTQSIKLSWTQI